MKILFVENKYKTKLYQEVSIRLEEDSIECHFLIQNSLFKATVNNHFIGDLPYTPDGRIETLYEECSAIIRESDRGVNYFGNGDNHYKGYFYSIFNTITSLKPNVVYGESTLFHELMVIYICKNLNVPYFHPSGCRMPSGRFSFYKSDTLIPTVIQDYSADNEAISEFIESYGYRKKQLDYMAKPKQLGKLLIKFRMYRNWLSGLITYSFYERFNTPSLLQKLKLSNKLKCNIQLWEQCASSEIKSGYKSVLYPLHMQPECNVDVWSRKYRKQYETITKLSQQLPENWLLYVKPNPKSKYEMTEELIQQCMKLDNVVMLTHNITMGDIEEQVDLFVTASGTVAYECYLKSKPCLSLSLPFFEDVVPSRHLNGLEGINFKERLSLLESDYVDESKLLNYLISSSYSGLISDPISSNECLTESNLGLLKAAFLDNLEKESIG